MNHRFGIRDWVERVVGEKERRQDQAGEVVGRSLIDGSVDLGVGRVWKFADAVDEVAEARLCLRQQDHVGQ